MNNYYWHNSELHLALPLLLETLGYATTESTLPIMKLPDLDAASELQQWFAHIALTTKIEIQNVNIFYGELGELTKNLRKLAPAILQLEKDKFIVLLSSHWGKLRLLGKDGQIYKRKIKNIQQLLVQKLEKPLFTKLEQTIAPLQLTRIRHDKVLSSLLHQQLVNELVANCFLLRPSINEHFWQTLLHAAIPQKITAFIFCLLASQILMLLSWLVIGLNVFHTAGFNGMLALWSLLLFTAIPLQILSLHIKNGLSLDVGCLLRKRLFEGILHLKPADVQHQGSGSFLGQVMNIEFLEGQCLSMVFVSFMALVSLLIAIYVLQMGAGGWLHAALLCSFLLVFFLFALRHYKHMRAWVLYSRTISLNLTENMLGHRTRLAQQVPELWHKDEDMMLSRYAILSERWDHSEAIMKTLVGRRGWLLIGLLGLYPTFMMTNPNVTLLAISIGGILLAAVALEQLSQSFRYVTGAMIVWQQLRHLYQSNEHKQLANKKSTLRYISKTEILQRNKHTIINAKDISFTYDKRPTSQVLHECTLHIDQQHKLLLTGISGGGKSTFAALLAGLQPLQHGNIDLFGLSQAQWGDERWRQQVVVAPQFQENYIFNETFAFNLLMGCNWPPNAEALLEAELICHELQLGNLLDNMPAGIQQMLGESGWQLSHGERSRVFIARTLLQHAPLIILDESFAALDASTLKTVLNCVLRRSNALLLIAHP